MNNEQIIQDAINRSISHTEIVHVTVDSDSGEILELINATILSDWDYTQDNRDDEGNEVLDVYSLAGSREQWRINITFKEETSE